MEIKGKIKHFSEKKEGVSAAGNAWSSQSVVIDYVAGKKDDGTKIVKQGVFQGMNKSVEFMEKMSVGDAVIINFNIEAREYKGQWYGTNSIWKIEKLDTKAAPAPPPPPVPEDDDSDLPF